MFHFLLIFIVLFMCSIDLPAFDYNLIQPQPQTVFVDGTKSNISGKNLKKLHFKVSPAGAQDARTFAEQLQRLLKWKINITIDSKLKKYGDFIFIADIEKSIKKPTLLKKSGHNSGYKLIVHENGVRLIGDDCDGFYYGLQTIIQIFLQAAEGGDAIPPATIIDWPSLSRRAIAIDLSGLTSGNKINEASFAVLGALKYNKVILYFHQSFPGEKYHFKKRRPNPLTEKQATQIKEICRRHHLRISLAFQFGSHMSWFLLSEPDYKDLYEMDKMTPSFTPSFGNSNWCPTNPRLWNLVESILERQLKFFDPEYVLIGHDEMDYGNIKTCDRCIKSSFNKNELVAHSIKKCHEIIKRISNAKTLLWHDQLLSNKLQALTNTPRILNGPEILKQLPKDIGIVAWHYNGNSATPSIIDYFRKNGHDIWLASFTGNGLKNNPQYAALYNVQGVILTLWYTVSNWLSAPAGISRIAMNSVVSNANWSWKFTAPSVPVDRKDNIHIFKLLYRGTKFGNRSSLFMPLDISKPTNLTTFKELKKYPTLKNLLNTVGTGKIFAPTNKVPYQIEQGKIVLAGGLQDKGILPESVIIPVNRKVNALHFLHACNRPQKLLNSTNTLTAMPKIGEYRLIPSSHKDKVVTIPLRYRREITDWSNNFSAWLSPTIKRDVYNPVITYQLTALSWNAPRNRAIKIKEIQFKSTLQNGMNPILFAVTSEKGQKALAGSNFSKIIWQDNFNYSSNTQLRKEWNFTNVPKLEKGKFPFVGNAMSISLSPNGKRVDIGWNKPAHDFSEATAISFDLKLNFNDAGTLVSYVYLQNPEKSYYYMSGIGLSRKKKGWQKIVMPFQNFKALTAIPKGYGKNSITRLKFVFFYKTSQAGEIKIGNIKIGKYKSEIITPTN